MIDDRYIVLVGGSGFEDHIGANTTDEPISSHPSLVSGSICTNAVMIYDVVMQQWSYTNSLPLDISIPFTVVEGDYLYIMGGEMCQPSCVGSQKYGVHVDLVLRARIIKRHSRLAEGTALPFSSTNLSLSSITQAVQGKQFITSLFTYHPLTVAPVLKANGGCFWIFHMIHISDPLM